MEEDASRLLRKVVKTMSAAIVWLLINMTFGIYFGWMFYYKNPTIGNYIFYAFMGISLVLFILYIRKVWKEYF
jgi:hypothetical protein